MSKEEIIAFLKSAGHKGGLARKKALTAEARRAIAKQGGLAKAKKEKTMKSKKAFTLIELLVVIAIIAVLAGLLMPALKGARNAAKKSSTSVTLGVVQMAIKSYYMEFGDRPAAVAGDVELSPIEVDAMVQKMAMTYTTATPPVNVPPTNSRQIDFLNALRGKQIKQVNGLWAITDAWGDPIHIAIDGDYDDKVQPVSGGDIIQASGCAAWSYAGNKYADSATAFNSANEPKLVKSWK